MNIIKLKDIIMPETEKYSDFFNKHLKGKYAYWVQMRYIVSFDHMRHEGYVACEEDITKLLVDSNGYYPKPYGVPCIDVYDPIILKYIDTVETDRINSIRDLRMKNKYVTDEDITLDEIKSFRTWLASEILAMDQSDKGNQRKIYLNDIETHVLEYYANNMYDSTIKVLSEFGSPTVSVLESKLSDCGCVRGTDLSSIYDTSLNVCDPISIYRKNIYNKMIQMFSSIDFWLQWSQEFIGEIKKYVDNIINVNLPLVPSKLEDGFIDCSCKSNIDNNYMDILKRLSISLEYIKNNDIQGHKNYISDALKDWSTVLYENMQW